MLFLDISTFLHIWSSHFISNWYTMLGTKVSQGHVWEVKFTQCLYLTWEKNSYFNSFSKYLITYYHVSIMVMSLRQLSLKVIHKWPRSFKICTFHEENVSIFNSFWICIDHIRQNSLKVILEDQSHSEHTPSLWKKCYFNNISNTIDLETKVSQGIPQGHL
jgi:hypothetical protein